MNDISDIRIEKLVYGGDAIGKLVDGRTVFVPFAIPGELVRLRIVEDKGRYARAELVEVLEPSSKRITARCGHFTHCGGCHYQHMKYADQLDAKKAILQEQLERIGGLGNIPPIEVIEAPEEWLYRNHIQFHLTGEGKLGFQEAHSNQTLPIRECYLPELSLNQLWPQIEIEPIFGLDRVSIRAGVEEDLMLILEGKDLKALDFCIEELAVSVVQISALGNVVLAGSDHITMEISGRPFRVSSAAFFQVNSLQANTMVKHVQKSLNLDEGMTVLDVYCGVGLFSAFMAPKVKQLVGIESSLVACDDFTFNLDEFENVSLYEAPAENVLSSINFNPDVILVDPPREGLGRKTVDGILSQGATQLMYISCDPATLARDAKRLETGGYKLFKITLFDMFPQTYHIETISYWEKKK